MLFVVLTQASLCPRFPGQLGFALRAVSSAHLPLSSGAVGLRSFQVSSPALPVQWGWGPLSAEGGVCLWILPGKDGEGPLQAISKFS